MTLKGGSWEVKIFWHISIITLDRFDLDWIWHGNTGGEKHISRGPPLPRPWAAAPRRSQSFGGPPVHARTQYEKQRPNFAWCSMWGKILHGRQRMLTRDLFVTANFSCFFWLAFGLTWRSETCRSLLSFPRHPPAKKNQRILPFPTSVHVHAVLCIFYWRSGRTENDEVKRMSARRHRVIDCAAAAAAAGAWANIVDQ